MKWARHLWHTTLNKLIYYVNANPDWDLKPEFTSVVWSRVYLPTRSWVHNVIIAFMSSYAIRRWLYGNTWVSNSDPQLIWWDLSWQEIQKLLELPILPRIVKLTTDPDKLQIKGVIKNLKYANVVISVMFSFNSLGFWRRWMF